MTQTADVPAGEPVSQIPRELARVDLEPRPETLRSRAALLYERVYDSLIPRLEVQEPHSRRTALDTANTLCPEYDVARYLQPDFLVRAWHFRICLACALSARVTRARWGVRWCTDSGCPLPTLGTAPPYDRSAQKMGNSVPRYPRAKASHSAAKVFNALAAPNGCSPGPRGVWPTSNASRPRSATGRRPNHGSGMTHPPACAPSRP